MPAVAWTLESQVGIGGLAAWAGFTLPSAVLMVAAVVLVLLVPRVWAQLLALVLGGLVGWCAMTSPELEPSAPERLVVPLQRSVAVGLLACAVLLVVALLCEARPLLVQQLSGFLHTGALVFGGGHVVLPLLSDLCHPKRLEAPHPF
ncbi:hypothetical protein [Parasynechococcus sp.]|uniref:hypothetical protein n=1 Tax=Parasynechococcus sp. TaxID=3101203 RepID=UPI003703A60E